MDELREGILRIFIAVLKIIMRFISKFYINCACFTIVFSWYYYHAYTIIRTAQNEQKVFFLCDKNSCVTIFSRDVAMAFLLWAPD